MYTLEEKFSDMYKTPNRRFCGKRIKEYIKSVDIKQHGIDGKKMAIKTVTMDGRHINMVTTGTMTIGQIIDKLVKEYDKAEQ